MVSATALRVVEIMAALTSVGLICSPSITMLRIYKRKDVGVVSVAPLAILLANGHMWMLYGYMTKNWFPLFWVFVFSDVFALTYLAIFWRYTTERRQFAKVVGTASTFLCIATLYAIIGGLGFTGQTRKQVGSTIGIICDVVGVCLYAAPGEKLVQVLRYTSAVFINAHMVMASLANNIMWVTYGILTSNWIILGPNIFFVTLNSCTLMLYIVFHPKTHPLPDDFNQLTEDGNSTGSRATSRQIPLHCQKASTVALSPVFEGVKSPLETIV